MKREKLPLRSCPFCGKRMTAVISDGIGLRVVCLNTKCYMHGPRRLTSAGAKKAWETRREPK